MASKYIQWPRIRVDPEWSAQWFYHRIHTPDLVKFDAKPPVYVWEWFMTCPIEGGFQTSELLERIGILRGKRVTTASVMKNWKQRGIQALQKRKSFGFQYEGAQDDSRISTETIDAATTLKIVQKIFPDQSSVPYVPSVYRASNPPPQVRYSSTFSLPFIVLMSTRC